MDAVCASCNDPLVIVLDDSEDDDVSDVMSSGKATKQEETVPDDVHLKACGHHFHWYALYIL